MRHTQKLTAIIERENNGYVSLCPELDLTSKGSTREEAQKNLIEAIELFLEFADPQEVIKCLKREIFVTQLEINIW